MKSPSIIALTLSLFVAGASLAGAHAFLDHADPKVGSTVNGSPTMVKIWFTQEPQEALSKIEVFDAKGREVDKKNVKVDSTDKTLMSVSVSSLPAGTYKVMWNAVCPLGHHTTGSFTFEVMSP